MRVRPDGWTTVIETSHCRRAPYRRVFSISFVSGFFFTFQPTYGGIRTKSKFNIIMLCVNKHHDDRCCLIDYRRYFLVILTRCPWSFIVPLRWYLLCYIICLSSEFWKRVFLCCAGGITLSVRRKTFREVCVNIKINTVRKPRRYIFIHFFFCYLVFNCYFFFLHKVKF